MDISKAVDFVRSLLSETENRDEFTDAPAVVVSTLSTIIQLASHVQELTANCPEMANVTIGVYGSRRSEISQQRSGVFTLFGPRVEDIRNSIPVAAEGSNGGTAVGVCLNEGRDPRAESRTALRYGPGTSIPEEVVGRQRSEGTDTRGNAQGHFTSVLGASVDLGASGCTKAVREVYVIPDEVAVTCLSHLLDMSGCTSHSRSYRTKDVDSINARLVQAVAKNIFKKHKDHISSRGVRSYGIQYQSLVPDIRKGKDIILPRIRLSRNSSGSSYIREGRLKNSFSIGKADWNKKEQNIALIASILHHKGHGVDVEDILTKFGRQGLGSEGCKRFGGCRLLTNTSNTMACKDSPKDTCSLYKDVGGERKIVAKGSVDPFLTYILGNEIPRTAIAVCVKTVTCSVGIEKHRSEEGVIHENWYVWPRKDVGRFEFLGEFKEVLGTCIFVRDLVPNHGREGTNNCTSESSMNIYDAVLLCDVKLAEGKERETYPFEEWYGNAYVRRIRELQQERLKELLDVLRNVERTMLWNSGRVRERENS